jgi:GntR family transcriptional regulator
MPEAEARDRTITSPYPCAASPVVPIHGVPVFHLVRTAYDTEGRAVEVCDTIMAADSYVLAYRLPAW